MADFLGALFEAIGKTFEAGAAVNQAQIGEREQKRQLQDNAQQRYYDVQNNQTAYLASESKQNTTLLIVVMVSAIAFVIILIIFRKR